MTKKGTYILAAASLIASHHLMFNLGRSTSMDFKSPATTAKTMNSISDSASDKNTGSSSSSTPDKQKTTTQDNSAAIPPAPASEPSPPSLSKFDVIKETLYKEASKAAKNTRKKFTLDGWERGTGGLDDDDRLVLGELYYNATSVFEYGLGESTRIAAATGVPRYSGVDSDPVWVAKARMDANRAHFRFNYGDIGDTGTFGHPLDKSLQKIQYDYQIASLILEDSPFDVYLVDGRYRVACACLSFLHAIKTGGDMEIVRVAIHDNDQKGRGYGIFQDVADLVIRKKKLWVYKIKPETTQDDLYNMWVNMHNKVIR
jgi:hypothetical protein